MLSFMGFFAQNLWASDMGALSLMFKIFYFFETMERWGLISTGAVVVFSLLATALLAFGLGWLVVKTIRMKKDTTAMGAVLGKEGEVSELTDDFGKRGWILIHGENWRFQSDRPLKKGDIVKVTGEKRMKLKVEKI